MAKSVQKHGETRVLQNQLEINLTAAIILIALVCSGCAGVTSQGNSNSTKPEALFISAGSLPFAQTQNQYFVALSASGGTPPYTWVLESGNLPSGLTLSATGMISGLPTQTGNYTFTVQVNDSSSPVQSALHSFTLTTSVTAPLNITTASLASGQDGMTYSQTLTATGGTTPYTWTLTSGTLPAGLTLNSSTGLISGTPTATANATSLTFVVTDSTTPSSQTNTTTLPITITGYSVLLHWTASTSPTAWGYNVYRSSVSGSGYTKISLSPVSGSTYTDTLVVSGQTYYYDVTTVDSSGDESAVSNDVQEVIP